jgi:hypothetical protein
MSSTSNTILCGTFAGLPKLNTENFIEWDIQIMAYLTGAEDHVCMITATYDKTTKKWADPEAPDAKDADACKEWLKSECITFGAILANCL